MISFDVPNFEEDNQIVRVVVSGNSLSDSSEAEGSAVRKGFLKLYQLCGYAIVDYNYIRGSVCGIRYADVVDKLEESKRMYDHIENQYVSALKQLGVICKMLVDSVHLSEVADPN